ncbi:MAG: ROK family protein [Planctomycetota bacterium]|nr:MAG: ROK family protein [Planctomycetota bacterium]REJ91516.1 MAG: ROK family protein [Planctomycetota bacterium]REK27029.1 MAG: ROK family protein [Planctomycetota bacterium]REK44387.1 MAG: ROK family protein [Planctomycetota bacterium]
MLSVVFDDEFHALAQNRKRTNGNEGVEAGLDRIEKTIAKSLDEAKLTAKDLAGIGIGCPGPVDLEAGILCEAPNLGWEEVPLQEHLQSKFNCPVVVCNDVDAGVYGEYRFGAARGARCALGVFPGTGIGGGCVYEGRIIRGQRRSCMEIGHIPATALGPPSPEGRRGTLETLASRLAIAAAVAQAAYRGEAPHVVELAGTDLAKIRSGVIAKSIRAGDSIVEEIVRQAAEVIGRAVAAAVLMISPDTIVLGGGLVEAMPELFVTEVHDAVARNVLDSFAGSYRVTAAELGDDATAMGVAAWAQREIDA